MEMSETNKSEGFCRCLSSLVNFNLFTCDVKSDFEKIFQVPSYIHQKLSKFINKIKKTEWTYNNNPTHFMDLDIKPDIYNKNIINPDTFKLIDDHFLLKYKDILRKHVMLCVERFSFWLISSGAIRLLDSFEMESFFSEQYGIIITGNEIERQNLESPLHECSQCCFSKLKIFNKCLNPYCNTFINQDISNYNNFICCFKGSEILKRIKTLLVYNYPEITYYKLIDLFIWIFLHFSEDESKIYILICSLLKSKHYDYFDIIFSRTVISGYILRHVFRNFLPHCISIPKLLSMKIPPQLKELLDMKLSKKEFQNNPKSKKMDEFVSEKWLIEEFKLFMLMNMSLSQQARFIDSLIIEGPVLYYSYALFYFEIYVANLCQEATGFAEFFELEDFIFHYGEIIKESAEFDAHEYVTHYDLKAYKIKSHFDFYTELYKANIIKQNLNSNSEIQGRNKNIPRLNSEETTISLNVPHSHIMNVDEWEYLFEWIPYRIKIMTPCLVFTTQKDGYNLKTLYQKAKGYYPLILIIHTKINEVFGAFISYPLTLRHNNHFFGDGETFLFILRPYAKQFKWVELGPPVEIKNRKEKRKKNSRVKRNSFSSYFGNSLVLKLRKRLKKKNKFVNLMKKKISMDPSPAEVNAEISDKKLDIKEVSEHIHTRSNSFVNNNINDSKDNQLLNNLFISGSDKCLIIGGGGNFFGIRLDSSLCTGNSSKCYTFDNPSLTTNSYGDFDCLGVELIIFKEQDM